MRRSLAHFPYLGAQGRAPGGSEAGGETGGAATIVIGQDLTSRPDQAPEVNQVLLIAGGAGGDGGCDSDCSPCPSPDVGGDGALAIATTTESGAGEGGQGRGAGVGGWGGHDGVGGSGVYGGSFAIQSTRSGGNAPTTRQTKPGSTGFGDGFIQRVFDTNPS